MSVSSFKKYPVLTSFPIVGDDTSPYADQIKSWTSYTQYLAAYSGLIRSVDNILKGELNKDVYQKVDRALRAVYAAVEGVDNEFISGIKDMQRDNPPKYSFDPAPIPDWPDQDTSTIFQGAWQILKPMLEVILSKTGSGSAMTKAIAGLINAGDKFVEELNILKM